MSELEKIIIDKISPPLTQAVCKNLAKIIREAGYVKPVNFGYDDMNQTFYDYTNTGKYYRQVWIEE